MEEVDDEKRPLLVNESQDDYGAYPESGKQREERKCSALVDIEVKSPPVRCPCGYVVEPALLVYAIVGSMVGDLGKQYTFKKVAEEMGPQYANFTTNNGGESGGCNISDVNSTDYIMRQNVQKHAAQFMLYSTLACFVPTIVIFMFWGAYSDRWGRKLLMVLPPIGCIMESVFYVLTMKLHLSQYVLFLCPMMEALIGGQELLVVGAVAYIADTASPETKAFRIALVDIMLMAGYGIGEFLLGYLIKTTGFFWPFIVIIGGKFYVLIHILLLVPETRPVINKQETGESILRFFLGTTKVYMKPGLGGRRWKLLLLLFVYFIPKLCHDTNISTLFELNAPLCWSSFMLGIFKGVFITAMALGILMGSKLFTRCLPPPWVTSIGLFSGLFEFLYMAFVRNSVMMLFVPLIGMFHLLPSPMIRTLMSDLVEPAEQGAMLAGMLLVDKLSKTLADLILNPVYQATVDTCTGCSFLVTGAAYFLGLLLLMLYIGLTKRKRLTVVPALTA